MTGRLNFAESRLDVRLYGGVLGGTRRWILKRDLVYRHGRPCFLVRTEGGTRVYAIAKILPTGYGAPCRAQLIDPETGEWTSENELRQKYDARSQDELDREAIAKMPWEEYGAEVPL